MESQEAVFDFVQMIDGLQFETGIIEAVFSQPSPWHASYLQCQRSEIPLVRSCSVFLDHDVGLTLQISR